MLFDTVPYRLASYVFSPRWFYGFDSAIELIGVVVCFLLLYYSYKCFKITKENKYLYFSVAFFSLTLGFICKIIGTLTIYKPSIARSAVGAVVHNTFTGLTPYYINALGFLFHIFFTLLGFMVLFLIISKLRWRNQRVIVLLVYFVFVSAWLSAIHYQLFYATSFVLLFLITCSYYKNYLEIGSEKSFFVFIAFFILLLSQAFFMFSIYMGVVYVLAEMLQLLGFVYLLVPFILIFKRKPRRSEK